jgi:hypothetical protein
VAEDLIARKITSPAHLGIQGGSNGGLLMGNMFTMYPRAVRRDRLPGAAARHAALPQAAGRRVVDGRIRRSRQPEEWELAATFSPYHNVKADVEVPEGAVHHLDARRPRAPRPRAQDDGAHEEQGTTCSTTRTSRAATAAPPTTSRSQGFRPPRRRPSYFSLRAQREVTKRKGTRLRRRTSSGALRCSPDSGRRELAHPCARTCAPFPRARLRCSAPETGGRARSNVTPRTLLRLLGPVDRGVGPEDQCATPQDRREPSRSEGAISGSPSLWRTKPRDQRASGEQGPGTQLPPPRRTKPVPESHVERARSTPTRYATQRRPE